MHNKHFALILLLLLLPVCNKVVQIAMGVGIQSQKSKKQKTVLQKGLPQRGKRPADPAEAEAAVNPEVAVLQKDPLRGKVREVIPDANLIRAMKW